MIFIGGIFVAAGAMLINVTPPMSQQRLEYRFVDTSSLPISSLFDGGKGHRLTEFEIQLISSPRRCSTSSSENRSVGGANVRPSKYLLLPACLDA